MDQPFVHWVFGVFPLLIQIHRLEGGREGGGRRGGEREGETPINVLLDFIMGQRSTFFF